MSDALRKIAEQIEAGEQSSIAAVNENFTRSWRAIQAEVHTTARDKGWWDDERRFGDILSLTHAELSEALEAFRAGNPPSDHIPAFTGIEEEFADVVIRMMDYADHVGLRLPEAILAKMAYNRTRPHRHGGKKL